MPVIGRLDDQVNNVIISPVGARRARGEGEDRHIDAEGSRPTATDDSARDENARGRERRIAAGREDNEPEGEQLPVWLL